MPDPVLAIVGPTGAGKSAMAIEVAERLGAEIVAVDAFTVYRGMDVGTAKPTAEERARVRHHMVDVLDPSQECTVQWFQQEARRAVADIQGRGRLPLLVGGSGLYCRAVVDPLEFPPTDPEVRLEVEERFAGDPEAAYAALLDKDPDAAARIDPGNLRRSVRALEVIALTGRQFSDWRRAWDTYESIYPGLRVAGLNVPRGELSARIEARVRTMLAEGLLDECRALAAHRLSRTARQAIGYAEVLDHLAGRGGIAETEERIIVRTRQYAAKQQRWFASDPRVRWTRPTEGRLIRDIVEVLRSPCGL
jgi:tRNA dimethylallyltransferase